MAQIFDTPIFSGDQSIDRVLNAGRPVLLVVVNNAPPVALEQATKALAKQETGHLLVVQVDGKDNPGIMRRYTIQGMPAVVAIKNGQALCQADTITAGDLDAHAKYLLDKGPKPEAKKQPSQAGQPSNNPGTRQTSPSGSSAYRQPGSSPAGSPVNITDASFEQEVMHSPIPVVVDFWAPWCGPCRMVAPTLEKLAREWNGKVKIAKVNVDENPVVAGRHRVSSIPTMMVVVNGRVVDTWAGALPEPALRSRLSAAILI